MSFPKTSPLFQLGYLNQSSQIPTGISGTPSASAIAEQGVHVSLDPQVSQPVNSGVLNSIIQTTIPPTFVSESDNTNDSTMEQLLQKGYVIENRVYEGSSLSYFIAKTRLGDHVFIRIDNSQYSSTFPISNTDIQMENRSSVVVVPQETKMGILQCLEYDICGAAFICNNSVCVSQRKSLDPTGNFSEQNFIFKNGNPSFVGAKFNNSIVAYPVVPLSEILKDPIKSEERIAGASNAIAKVAFIRLRSYNQDLNDAIKKLIEQSSGLDKTIDESEKRMSDDIKKLSDAYESIKDIHPNTLSDIDQSSYYAIQRTLADLKDLRTQFLNSFANAYKVSGMCRSVTEELRNNIEPVLNSV